MNNKGRCLIADEMGLGKTFQALAIASYYRDDWPVLIVTTSSMRYSIISCNSIYSCTYIVMCVCFILQKHMAENHL